LTDPELEALDDVMLGSGEGLWRRLERADRMCDLLHVVLYVGRRRIFGQAQQEDAERIDDAPARFHEPRERLVDDGRIALGAARNRLRGRDAGTKTAASADVMILASIRETTYSVRCAAERRTRSSWSTSARKSSGRIIFVSGGSTVLPLGGASGRCRWIWKGRACVDEPREARKWTGERCRTS
jgi:hypothetical protein